MPRMKTQQPPPANPARQALAQTTSVDADAAAAEDAAVAAAVENELSLKRSLQPV